MKLKMPIVQVLKENSLFTSESFFNKSEIYLFFFLEYIPCIKPDISDAFYYRSLNLSDILNAYLYCRCFPPSKFLTFL